MDLNDLMKWLPTVAQAAYFVAAVLFILGIKRMSSPVTARKGIVQAGWGMVIATVATFGVTGAHNVWWILGALALGIIPAWWKAKTVAMTAMPQQVALYNGMGGGSAAAIGAVELLKFAGEGHAPNQVVLAAAVIGALIGSISLTGSVIAWAKLEGVMDKRFTFPGQQFVNLLFFLASMGLGAALFFQLDTQFVIGFFVLALLVGILMTLPIGGADMPVVISLYNAFTGLAVAFEGYVMQNPALIIAGMVVGSAGTLLTQLMAKAMNRSLGNVLFGAFGATTAISAKSAEGLSVRQVSPDDAAVQLAFARSVIVVPGYGLAVAQAQHLVRELADLVEKKGGEVKYAIHPVAGRMPGHMNVLLAEANVPYDKLFDMDQINSEFERTDVVLVIGANDVVNPAARTDPSSPIYGMPILNVDQARSIIVLKRGMGAGFAGIENELFYNPKTAMLFGDAKASLSKLVGELKAL